MTKNINYVSHKKSKVKNNGKPQLPSANSLVEGEIAINYAKDVETLSIKNESGTVVTFSSDNYYTEKKLGSGFTESNSAVTVTDAIFKVEKAISDEMSRATAAESALSSGKADKATTLAGYGITDAYTKSQTYTKTEVNGMVDTPHQNYVTVATYAALPTTGSADTIYRVSNWDGSANSGAGAVDVTVYSEYAWDDASNPNKYVFLCVKSQIGEVFDISAYNNNAKYDTLADALGTNGEHVPQSIRRGGMSVKYVQNSDNKYICYMYNGTATTGTPNPFLDVTNWEQINLEEEVSQLGQKVDDLKEKVGIQVPYSIAIDSKGGKNIPYIGKAGDKLNITLSANGVVSTENTIVIYAENDTHLLGTLADGQTIDVVLPIDITKFYLWVGESAYLGPGTVALVIKDTDNIVDTINNKIDANNSYAQFEGGAKPTIEKSNANKYTITFPSGIFVIRYNNGGNILSTSSYAGESFDIPYGNKLVFDRNDSTIKVVGASVKGDYILLLANAGGGVDGLFANFCIDWRLQKEIDNNDVFAYFGSGDKPTFTKSGTTVNVAFPSNALTIYYNNGGSLITLSSFVSQNWDVPVGRKLVYDIANNTVSVIVFATEGDYIVLFENGNRGCSGLLANYYIYMSAQSDNEITEKVVDPVLYFANFLKPSFAINTQGQITVTFPNDEMRIYARNGGTQIVSTMAFAGQSYTVDILKHLVYDLSTGTISVKSYTATAAKQIVLLANRNGMVLSGLLLPYYNDWLSNNDIINANNIAEITNIFQQANFPAKIATTNQNKQLVLLHFSDIHFSSQELGRIAHLAKSYEDKITDVLCTGDVVNRSYNETQDADFTAFWAEASKYLVAIGNHDTAKYENNEYDWDYYAGKDAYDRYLSPYISEWGVTQPSGAATNGYCYYYKDYTQEGIRLIVLDAMKYDTTQDDWFKSVLASAQTSGLAVIVAEHFPPADITHTNNVFDAPGPDFWRGSEVNILNPLAAQTVDGFMNGTLAGMSDNGEFICWLAGHTHKDTFAKLEDYPNQYCVLITCATASNLYGDQDRVRGTKSQDALNIVAVDTYSKTLRLFRIGADYDRLLRHRYTLCWNYETHELVYES